MLQSSETKKADTLIHLGYPEGAVHNGYYTARALTNMGVTVAFMMGDVAMIQFFPWEDSGSTGHTQYAKFITDRASQIMASRGLLFSKYPFETVKTTDLLMIKCIIENMIEEIKDGKYSCSAAGREAGEALE